MTAAQIQKLLDNAVATDVCKKIETQIDSRRARKLRAVPASN